MFGHLTLREQFQEANEKAMYKILKKHTKRTALPHPLFMASQNPSHDGMTLTVPSTLHTLPRSLVQAVGEILIPIIPSLDDYSCFMNFVLWLCHGCTSIANYATPVVKFGMKLHIRSSLESQVQLMPDVDAGYGCAALLLVFCSHS